MIVRIFIGEANPPTHQEDGMQQAIRLDVDKLEVRSFITVKQDTARSELAPTDFCGSAVSETNGVYLCKSCGPCCV